MPCQPLPAFPHARTILMPHSWMRSCGVTWIATASLPPSLVHRRPSRRLEREHSICLGEEEEGGRGERGFGRPRAGGLASVRASVGGRVGRGGLAGR